MTILRPRFAWVEDKLLPGVEIEIDDEGRISRVQIDGGPHDPALDQVALFPGFVNAHSHAFQWALRGAAQRAGRGGNFFTWRDQMFQLADFMDPEGLKQVARRAFSAMRAAGWTSVGEFHYLHHKADGTPYEPSTRMARVLVEAARKVGMRICLLHSAYFRGSGVVDSIAAGQRRFCDPDIDAFLNRHLALSSWIASLDDPRVTLGVAPHSVRAVPLDALSRIGEVIVDQPLHIHVAEQEREVEECLTEYGSGPLTLLETANVLNERTTLVHMTQASAGDLEKAAQAGANVCLCPTTERDLGDGVGPAPLASRLKIPMCLGSDSQVQMDPLTEMRLVEQHERLERRGRMFLPTHKRRSLAAELLCMATANGARSLGIDVGEIAPGRWADLVEVNVNDPDLRHVDNDLLPDVLVFGGSPRCIRATWVGGKRKFTGQL